MEQGRPAQRHVSVGDRRQIIAFGSENDRRRAPRRERWLRATQPTVLTRQRGVLKQRESPVVHGGQRRCFTWNVIAAVGAGSGCRGRVYLRVSYESLGPARAPQAPCTVWPRQAEYARAGGLPSRDRPGLVGRAETHRRRRHRGWRVCAAMLSPHHEGWGAVVSRETIAFRGPGAPRTASPSVGPLR